MGRDGPSPALPSYGFHQYVSFTRKMLSALAPMSWSNDSPNRKLPTFSDAARLLSSYEPVERKPKLVPSLYAPDGCTALYDAVLGAMTGLLLAVFGVSCVLLVLAWRSFFDRSGDFAEDL